MTIRTLSYPGMLFCAECNHAIGQKTPAGWQPNHSPAAHACVNPGCLQFGRLFNLYPTITEHKEIQDDPETDLRNVPVRRD